MFADVALAARIEAAEAALAAAIARGVRARGVEVALDAISGGFAALVRPGAGTNKIAGVGFGPPLDLDALAAIEATWWRRGEPVRFELSALADPALLHALGARGYRLHGFEHVLARRLGPADAAPLAPGVTVERVTAATSETWLEIGLDGFTVPDGAAPGSDPIPRDALATIFRDFAGVDELPRYLARVDGAPAGVASGRLADGVLQLCGATTAPPFRRRGVQRALLTTRLADAVAAGCDLAVVTTDPGSQSQANVMKLGFALLYARAVLLREPPTAAPAS